MRKRIQYIYLGGLIFLVSILIMCKSTIDEVPIIDVPAPTEMAETGPKTHQDCLDSLVQQEDFAMEDTEPEKQAVGCEGFEYPAWETSLYILPYPVGSGYTVDLNNCSRSYHGAGEPDNFATDFDMPIGTCLTASRAGTVIFVEESGKDGGFPNNKIIIGHGERIFSQYMHLTENGAFVEVGDKVEQGDYIGLSGSTGLAGYPHLHFIVTQNGWEYPYEGVPVTFKNTFANERGLASGKMYFALSYTK